MDTYAVWSVEELVTLLCEERGPSPYVECPTDHEMALELMRRAGTVTR